MNSASVAGLEKGSPAWCISKILEKRNQLEEIVEKRFQPKTGFVAGCILITTVLSFELWGFPRLGFKWPVLLNTDFVFGVAVTLWALVLNGRWGQNRWLYLIFWQTLAVILSFQLDVSGSKLWIWAIISGTYSALWFIFLWLKDKALKTRILGSVSFSLLMYGAIYYLVKNWHPFILLQFLKPQRFLLFFLPLIVSNFEWSAQSLEPAFRYFFFPINMRYPIPIGLNGLMPDRRRWKFQIRGFVDVLYGSTLLICVIFTALKKFPPLADRDIAQIFYAGFYSYIETYLISCGLVSLYVGLGRMTGFKLEDPYLVPLLASSPFERFRRWNTLLFNFFKWFVYVPLQRATKSLFIAVMATFLVTILFHQFASGPDTTAFFVAHGLAVYVSIKWNFKIYKSEARLGWWGVALTWLLMILVHNLNRWTVT